jgi:hypothetical protein
MMTGDDHIFLQSEADIDLIHYRHPASYNCS